MARLPQFATALGLVATMMATPAPASEPSGFEGVYAAAGPDGMGGEYEGFVSITRHGDSFLVAWFFPRHEGQTILLALGAIGVGIASEGALAVGYYGTRSTGVVLYRTGDDGRLIGKWTTAMGDGTVYSETLTRRAADTLPDLAAPTLPAAPVVPVRPSGRTL